MTQVTSQESNTYVGMKENLIKKKQAQEGKLCKAGKKKMKICGNYNYNYNFISLRYR